MLQYNWFITIIMLICHYDNPAFYYLNISLIFST